MGCSGWGRSESDIWPVLRLCKLEWLAARVPKSSGTSSTIVSGL